MTITERRRAGGRARGAAALGAVACVLLLGMSVPIAAPGGGASGRRAPQRAAKVAPGDTEEFSVTAYCTGRITKAGAVVKKGMAAADPAFLPLGSTLRVDGQGRAYDGVYTVMDTGSAVHGRELDLYLDHCGEADAFGRRVMRVTVIRRGWNPKATAASAGGPR